MTGTKLPETFEKAGNPVSKEVDRDLDHTSGFAVGAGQDLGIEIAVFLAIAVEVAKVCQGK